MSDEWPTVKCATEGCIVRLRMRTIGADDDGRNGRPDYEGKLGRDDQWCTREHRDQAMADRKNERAQRAESELAALRQRIGALCDEAEPMVLEVERYDRDDTEPTMCVPATALRAALGKPSVPTSTKDGSNG